MNIKGEREGKGFPRTGAFPPVRLHVLFAYPSSLSLLLAERTRCRLLAGGRGLAFILLTSLSPQKSNTKPPPLSHIARQYVRGVGGDICVKADGRMPLAFKIPARIANFLPPALSPFPPHTHTHTQCVCVWLHTSCVETYRVGVDCPGRR